jgi:transposase-like protein
MVRKTSYDDSFKAKVALEALKGDKTATEIANEYNVACSLVSKWKSELISNAAATFSKGKSKPTDSVNEQKLYEQIGKLSMEVDYLKKFVTKYR